MKTENAIDSSFAEDLDQDLVEFFSEVDAEKAYHRNEIHYWMNDIALSTKEVTYAIEKIKHHMSQLV